MPPARLGESVTRLEDDHLLRGSSTFVANRHLPDAAVVHFVTSTRAHARIVAIDLADAAVASGVLAVVTAADVAAAGLPPVLPGYNKDWAPEAAWPVLAADRVRYVGQPVVAIVAETEAAAIDAAELVVIDLEPLEPVIDPLTAADHPVRLFDGMGSNVIVAASLEGSTPIDFSRFEVFVESDFVNQRLAPCPMETRVAAAMWTDDDRLVQYASCQGAHPIRNSLAAYYGIDRSAVRVITADVGGSFGAKARAYAEDILLGHLARLVDRPVRWAPSRANDMVGLGHSRAQHQHVRIGGDRTGRIRGLEIDVIADGGAFPASQPAQAQNTGTMLPGPYDIAEVHWQVKTVLTNTTPIVAYRGAGRPEAGALVDRAIDLFAAEIDMDPLAVRRMNLISPEQMPYRNPTGLVYDSGDYPEALDQLEKAIDFTAYRSEQATRRDRGDTKVLGIGCSVFVDRTAGVRGPEYGSVQLKAGGGFRVLTGSSPYGQGHYTTWAQLVSERTGVAIDSIEVVHGDTDLVPRGGITGGSRSAQKAGVAVALATDDLVEVARGRAADLLEAAVGDVVLDVDSARFHVAGAPGATTVGWSEVATAFGSQDEAGERDTNEIVHSCENDFDNDGPSVPYGAFAAVVEVDIETGQVDLARMVTVNDVGTVINPMIVEGQIHGALGQAIGQALWEEFVYDSEGNPLTSTFLDYGIPSAAEMPDLEVHMTEHPSPTNPLGAKGVGEPGCVGGVPAVQNAVVDALAHLGVRHLDLPITPMRIWDALGRT